MSPPTAQTAIIQAPSSSTSHSSHLPLLIAPSLPLPTISSPHHILTRILAAGLNPTDAKMIINFRMPSAPVGCDFCGIVEAAGPLSTVAVGTRIIGADFPYRPNNTSNGAFAQYAVCDSRQTLRVPDDWSDVQAAGLGAIGWGTACLALSDPAALGLQGRPSRPVDKARPVLVYGGGTATGVLAIQMLKRSGYAPVVVCSAKSAPLAMECGAVGTASYTSATCVDEIKKLAGGPIKHALDCITNPQSVAICFGALARVGGRYACLEDCPEAWRPRLSVNVKIVMGFESKGSDVDLGHPVYTRKANPELFAIGNEWTEDMQRLLDQGLIKTLPVREIETGWDGVVKGLEMLHQGGVKGQKLAVRIGSG